MDSSLDVTRAIHDECQVGMLRGRLCFDQLNIYTGFMDVTDQDPINAQALADQGYASAVAEFSARHDPVGRLFATVTVCQDEPTRVGERQRRFKNLVPERFLDVLRDTGAR